MSISKDPTYPLFPILSCIGFVLCLIPLPWHIQAMNSGTVAFMLWTSALCLVRFVNSVVWAGNVNDVAPIWCDISTQIILGAVIGIPASTLCISRRLYRIASIRSVSVSQADKKRTVIEDVCIALGIPLVIMALHTIVHAHRYDILEDIGCQPVTYNTLPAYFLYFMWPIVLGFFSFIYSCLNLRAFYIRRLQFAQFMSSNKSMNMSRYLRLMTLSVVDILFTIPLSSYVIYIATHGVTLAPWISWEETHFNWLKVKQIPALFWRNNKSAEISIELNRWLPVFCAFIFFALFGFASEAKKHYRIAFWWCMKPLGLRPAADASALKGATPLPKCKPSAGLPSYLERQMPSIHLPTTVTTTNSSTDGTYVGSLPIKTKELSSSTSQIPIAPPPAYQYTTPDVGDRSDAFSLSSYTSSGSPTRSFISLADTENIRNSTYTIDVSISNTVFSHSSVTNQDIDVPSSPISPSSTLTCPHPAAPVSLHHNSTSSSLSLPSRTATPLNFDRTLTPSPLPSGPPAALRAASAEPVGRVYLTEASHARPSPPPFNELTFQPLIRPSTSSSAGRSGRTADDTIVITVHKSSESL